MVMEILNYIFETGQAVINSQIFKLISLAYIVVGAFLLPFYVARRCRLM